MSEYLKQKDKGLQVETIKKFFASITNGQLTLAGLDTVCNREYYNLVCRHFPILLRTVVIDVHGTVVRLST